MPPLIEQQLRSLLGQMADIVGPEYEVAFVAKNGKRNYADILLGDKDLNTTIRKRLYATLQLEAKPNQEDKQ